VDPVASSPFGGLLFEQLWSQLRQGLAVLGWMVLAGLVAAASCWCCGYVARCDLLGGCSPAGRRRSDGTQGSDVTWQPDAGLWSDSAHRRDDDVIVDEAARGIREIERYLSTV
jgi:hypothetical protein